MTIAIEVTLKEGDWGLDWMERIPGVEVWAQPYGRQAKPYVLATVTPRNPTASVVITENQDLLLRPCHVTERIYIEKTEIRPKSVTAK